MGASGFKSLDVYRDIPKDLTEQTNTGATVSVVAMTVMGYLFFSELLAWRRIELNHEMFVDATEETGNEHAMLQINMNISMPAIPCIVISVDAQDVMGSHVVDVGGTVHKQRLSKEGEIVRDANGQPLLSTDDESTANEQTGEGCRIWGNMIVKKVPGNFHISAHAHANLLHVFFGTSPLNVTHIIHDLHFGEQTYELEGIKGANVNPLKGAFKLATLDSGDVSTAKSFEYYLKVVPTTFRKLDGTEVLSYQFVANSNDIAGRYRIPALYFRYDMSAITVRFSEKRQTLSHFLVQICAIIGGVFTVLGLMSSMLNTTVRSMMRKHEIGKLG
eukprot:gb/GEZN01008101.1/.p1 GENE.gb/GEZN01008101.1/~~gb/GEZN01008101.1/.p1  ORF type:complete len:331 (-),score=47.64 gb/GEZN01008101.1/:447-1439(-)